jgi:anti-sigma-K factor RskA
MNENDNKLRALLHHWRDIEPAGNFEVNVRRRIRLATADSPRQSWLAGLMWRPAFAMAVVVSVLVGTSAGILSSHQQHSEMQFMSAGTLAGSYARLTTEGRR